MGLVSLLCVPFLNAIPLLPHGSCFLLWWGASAVLLRLTHILYQDTHEGRTLLIGVFLPSPLLVRVSTSIPLLHGVR